MASAPIILVPGFWLGAWAWDEVVAALRADGHQDVTAITLPGQASKDEDRSTITFQDHVDAITDAVEAKSEPVVLAVHSASGFTGYAASDRIPDRIAAMVYVDTAPGKPPLDPDFTEAWARLGGTLSNLYLNATPDPAVANRARAAVDRAIALHPDGAAGHRAMATYHLLVSVDHARAAEEMALALRADPNDPDMLRGAAYVGATYGLANRSLGAVGLLGPLRMDYEKAIRSVRAAAFELSRLVDDVYGSQ